MPTPLTFYYFDDLEIGQVFRKLSSPTFSVRMGITPIRLEPTLLVKVSTNSAVWLQDAQDRRDRSVWLHEIGFPIDELVEVERWGQIEVVML